MVPAMGREFRTLRATVVCAALLLAGWANGQHVVQAVVDGLSSPQVARQAGLLLQGQEGVLMARLDVPTRNMMLHVSERFALDRDAINTLLAPLGITARCFERRDARERPYQHLDPLRCGTQPEIDR
ncbi:MAG: hypothetical protein ACK4L7_00305 [Flavobacteriales bacterium]